MGAKSIVTGKTFAGKTQSLLPGHVSPSTLRSQERSLDGGDVRQSQMRGRLQSDAKLFRADTKWLNPEGQRPMSVFMKHADSFGVP